MGIRGSQPATPATVTGDGAVSASPCTLVGVTITHTAATTLVLYDNASAASGTKVATISCVANGTGYAFFGDEGIQCSNGIYADWTAGTGHVYFKA